MEENLFWFCVMLFRRFSMSLRLKSTSRPINDTWFLLLIESVKSRRIKRNDEYFYRVETCLAFQEYSKLIHGNKTQFSLKRFLHSWIIFPLLSWNNFTLNIFPNNKNQFKISLHGLIPPWLKARSVFRIWQVNTHI